MTYMEKVALHFSKEEIKALERIARSANLEGLDVLDQYTDDEKIESFNGTGGASMPEWKRYILTKLTGRKLPAILIHDMQYRRGGTEAERKETNSQLERNMMKLHAYDLTSGNYSPEWWWRYASRKAKEVTDSDEAKAGWGKA